MFCMLKKQKYILLMFQNITQIVFLLMIPNGKGLVAKSKGRRWHYLAAKRLSGMLEE